MKVDELGNPNNDVIADFVEHNQNIIAAQKAMPLNRDGLTAYFDQMATDGRVETTVEWLVDISLLIQDDVTKRLATAEGIPQSDGWVDVADRLPSADGEYLVTYKIFEGDGFGVSIAYFSLYWELYGTGGDDVNEVVAWMPLPPPYQRQSSEGE